MADQTSVGLPQISPPVTKAGLQSMTAKESRHELRRAIAGSNQVLFKVSTVLQLFPDTMTVNRAKVTIAKRAFYHPAT